MFWGMIPPWHKGNFNDHKLSTNNCRIETILESKLFKTPMQAGNRCVVVCDGFYEWQTTKGKGSKQPYFIYAPQKDSVKIDDPSTWGDCDATDWTGPDLLYMAALYSVWKSPQDEKMWSYSVITMESDAGFGWLHHRVPAVLDSAAAVNRWLNAEQVDTHALLANFTPNPPLAWHPVDTRVNNSRDKSIGLNRAIQLAEKKESKSATLMANWLKGSKRKVDDDAELEKNKKEKRNSEIDKM